jgi:anthranilate phosphoribosyltransferase
VSGDGGNGATGSGAIGFAEAFARLEGDTLDPAAVRAAFTGILGGEWTAVQVGAFATALRLRGETAGTIVAAALALRDAMTVVTHEHAVVVDTCGTGGDGAHTLNVSTAAALVVAASGYVVAKHGNRSVSSRCGSADVVEALGIPLELSPAEQSGLLGSAGIAFLLAPAHHPALRHASVARRELGVRTLFNVLGPLVNPARATHQLVGVYDDRLRPIVARALGQLGVVRAWVVRSDDGLDEISPAGLTRVSELSGGEVHERVVGPADFGVAPGALAGLAGGDAADNARALEALVDGAGHPAEGAVLLNAAAALHVAGFDPSLAVCFARAREAIGSGDTRRRLSTWREQARALRVAAPT